MAFSGRTVVAAERAALLVDSARALANERGDASFTIADVATRAGVSLKGFYATFSSKDELVIALLAADTVRGALLIGAAADRHDDPEERLRAWIRELLVLAALPEAFAYGALLARETRRLAQTHPDELGAALAPLLEALRHLLRDVGSPRSSRDALTVFGMVLDAVQRVTARTVEPSEYAEYLADFVIAAVRPDRGGQS